MSEAKLVPISQRQIVSLIDIYEKWNNLQRIEAVFNLRNYKTILEDSENVPSDLSLFRMYSLNNDFAEDGLFLFIIDDGIFPYTTKENNPRLGVAIKSLQHILELNFFRINSQQELIVRQTLKELNIEDKFNFIPYTHFHCSVEEALKLEGISVPKNIELKPLSPDSAPVFCQPEMELYIRKIIQLQPSIGAFDKETGLLLGWCLTYLNECHSHLGVKPEYQGRGLGSLLVKKLTHDRALLGKPSHCFIAIGNTASERIFSRAGFKVIGYSTMIMRIGTPDE